MNPEAEPSVIRCLADEVALMAVKLTLRFGELVLGLAPAFARRSRDRGAERHQLRVCRSWPQIAIEQPRKISIAYLGFERITPPLRAQDRSLRMERRPQHVEALTQSLVLRPALGGD